MSNDNSMVASRMTGLTNSINKANELKELELQAKSREIEGVERRNSIKEIYSEEMVKVNKKKNELKECELQAKTREIFAVEKKNELKERELDLKELELSNGRDMM